MPTAPMGPQGAQLGFAGQPPNSAAPIYSPQASTPDYTAQAQEMALGGQRQPAAAVSANSKTRI